MTQNVRSASLPLLANEDYVTHHFLVLKELTFFVLACFFLPSSMAFDSFKDFIISESCVLSNLQMPFGNRDSTNQKLKTRK